MEALPTLSYFLFGCNGTAFIYLHSTCYISLPKAIHKEFFLTSLSIAINKLSLNFLVKSQSSFIYIKVFNYDSFNLNQILLIRSGNIELNPGPKKSSSLSFFHWNLNETAAHDFAKISFIQSYGLSYNTDIIFLSETFLDQLRLVTLILTFQDIINCVLIIHQISKEEVCVCFIKTICVLYQNVLLLRLSCGKNLYIFFNCNYRSPSQTSDEFENHCQNFHLTFSNIDDTSPFCSIVIGDLNARCRNWWAGDVNSSTGKEL